MRVWQESLAAAVLVVCGCARDINNTEAVRQGVITHLQTKSGLDVSSMQVSVTSVSFRRDEADARVSFRAKNSTDPAGGMEMTYTLERKGSQWVVKNRRESGANPHGAGGPPPEQGAPPPGGGALPQGHPPIPPPTPGTKP